MSSVIHHMTSLPFALAPDASETDVAFAYADEAMETEDFDASAFVAEGSDETGMAASSWGSEWHTATLLKESPAWVKTIPLSRRDMTPDEGGHRTTAAFAPPPPNTAVRRASEQDDRTLRMVIRNLMDDFNVHTSSSIDIRGRIIHALPWTDVRPFYMALLVRIAQDRYDGSAAQFKQVLQYAGSHWKQERRTILGADTFDYNDGHPLPSSVLADTDIHLNVRDTTQPFLDAILPRITDDDAIERKQAITALTLILESADAHGDKCWQRTIISSIRDFRHSQGFPASLLADIAIHVSHRDAIALFTDIISPRMHSNDRALREEACAAFTRVKRHADKHWHRNDIKRLEGGNSISNKQIISPSGDATSSNVSINIATVLNEAAPIVEGMLKESMSITSEIHTSFTNGTSAHTTHITLHPRHPSQKVDARISGPVRTLTDASQTSRLNNIIPRINCGNAKIQRIARDEFLGVLQEMHTEDNRTHSCAALTRLLNESSDLPRDFLIQIAALAPEGTFDSILFGFLKKNIAAQWDKNAPSPFPDQIPEGKTITAMIDIAFEPIEVYRSSLKQLTDIVSRGPKAAAEFDSVLDEHNFSHPLDGIYLAENHTLKRAFAGYLSQTRDTSYDAWHPLMQISTEARHSVLKPPFQQALSTFAKNNTSPHLIPLSVRLALELTPRTPHLTQLAHHLSHQQWDELAGLLRNSIRTFDDTARDTIAAEFLHAHNDRHFSMPNPCYAGALIAATQAETRAKLLRILIERRAWTEIQEPLNQLRAADTPDIDDLNAIVLQAAKTQTVPFELLETIPAAHEESKKWLDAVGFGQQGSVHEDPVRWYEINTAQALIGFLVKWTFAPSIESSPLSRFQAQREMRRAKTTLTELALAHARGEGHGVLTIRNVVNALAKSLDRDPVGDQIEEILEGESSEEALKTLLRSSLPTLLIVWRKRMQAMAFDPPLLHEAPPSPLRLFTDAASIRNRMDTLAAEQEEPLAPNILFTEAWIRMRHPERTEGFEERAAQRFTTAHQLLQRPLEPIGDAQKNAAALAIIEGFKTFLDAAQDEKALETLGDFLGPEEAAQILAVAKKFQR